MEQNILITMSPADLQNLVKVAVREAQAETAQQENTKTSYSINKAAKLLGRSFTTVKNLIIAGKLETTSDGLRVTAQAINKYLKQPG